MKKYPTGFDYGLSAMTKEPNRPPLFEHDCKSCIYLGRHDTLPMDLYFCPADLLGVTVIARYGSEGSDYKSGLVFADHEPLLTAKKRAIARGLLNETT